MECIFSLNERIVGKDVEGLRQHNDAFVNVHDTLTPTQILDVCAGFGFATAAVLKKDGKRTGENVDGIRVVQLDFDNTWTISEATTHPLYQDYAIGLYSTPSHGKLQDVLPDSKAMIMSEAQAAVIRSRVGQQMIRFRLVFVLEEFLPVEHVSAFYAGLFTMFPMADVSCRDGARLFFGSPDSVVRIDNPSARRMDKDRVEAFVAAGMTTEVFQAAKAVKQVTASRATNPSRAEIPSSSAERFNTNLIVMLTDGEVTTCKELQRKMRPGYENRVSCFSPFREEQRPSAFVKKDESGRLYFYDTAIRKTYVFA